MKIEWLNPECTKARLTRGFFRLRFALVRREGLTWVYDEGKAARDPRVSSQLDQYLDVKRRKALENDDCHWKPVGRLPPARLLAKEDD